jgi:hypothetical protein
MDQIKCPSCGGPVARKDMDFNLMVAECPYCNVVTSIRERITDPIPEIDPIKERARFTVPMPPGFSISETDSRLTITRRWLSPTLLVISEIVTCALILGTLVLLAGVGLLFPLERDIIRKVLLLGLGVYALYWSTALLFNRTEITASSGTLEIRHRPVPWPGNRLVRTAAVRQLYCVQVIRRNKHGTEIGHTYTVKAQSGSKYDIPLVKGLSRHQAVFIEQSIERHLGITDMPVKGAV